MKSHGRWFWNEKKNLEKVSQYSFLHRRPTTLTIRVIGYVSEFWLIVYCYLCIQELWPVISHTWIMKSGINSRMKICLCVCLPDCLTACLPDCLSACVYRYIQIYTCYFSIKVELILQTLPRPIRMQIKLILKWSVRFVMLFGTILGLGLNFQHTKIGKHSLTHSVTRTQVQLHPKYHTYAH